MTSPFLKWAGGKAKLAPLVLAGAPLGFKRYLEPFVGGGALFFALADTHRVTRCTLNDSNVELMEAFTAVKERVEPLIVALETLAADYLPADQEGRAAFYYAQRARTSDQIASPVDRAARLIFLNRTCYNGLYRVNHSGRFNVPHGRYANPRIVDAPGLRACAAALSQATLTAEDFARTCAKARAGDFVYLDPPYRPLSVTSSFTAYTSEDFDDGHQQRLRYEFVQLTERGVAAALSNSDHPFIHELYAGQGFDIERVEMSRAINSKGSGRTPIGELLITNYRRPEVHYFVGRPATPTPIRSLGAPSVPN